MKILTIVGENARKWSVVVEDEIQFKEIRICTKKRTTSVADQDINLTKTEHAILLLLIEKQGKVRSKEEIAKHIYSAGRPKMLFGDYGKVYAHVKNLKRKLRSARSYIQTIYGVGYRLSE